MSDRLALFGGTPVCRSDPESWPPIDANLEARVLAALRGERMAYGVDSTTREFEEAFAAYHSRRWAIAANSGTSAILMGYYACGLEMNGWGAGRAGGDVVVPAYGFFATASPLVSMGARPIFCDVDERTGNLDPMLLESAITSRTSGIAVTHVAGQPAPMLDICRIADRHGLFVLEDCSHAHGARLGSRLVGSFGKVAAFSLQSGKMVTGGEGGMLLTDDQGAFVRAALLGNFRRLEGTGIPIPASRAQTGLGLKLRLSPLSAAMAMHFLSRLEDLVEMRAARLQALASTIEREAGHVFRVPYVPPDTSFGAWYEFHLRVDVPDMNTGLVARIREALVAEGVHVRSVNTCAIHLLPIFGGQNGEHPIAERLGWSTVALPTYTTEPMEVVMHCAQAVIKVARHVDRLRVGR